MTEIHVQKKTSAEMREYAQVPLLFVTMETPVPRTVATRNGAVCTWHLKRDAMMATPVTVPRSAQMTGVLVRMHLSAETESQTEPAVKNATTGAPKTGMDAQRAVPLKPWTVPILRTVKTEICVRTIPV